LNPKHALNHFNKPSPMHEASLVQNIFDLLESKFSEEELQTLERIDVQVGLLSNVEPLLLESAFEAVKLAVDKYHQVQLHMETVEVEIYCAECDVTSVIRNYTFVCEHCGTPNNHIVKGMELLISKVHFSGAIEVNA
jgi:hydrogenase nickel incorporation protein HypA/HybF